MDFIDVICIAMTCLTGAILIWILPPMSPATCLLFLIYLQLRKNKEI